MAKKSKCSKKCQNASMWEKLKAKALCLYARLMLVVSACMGY